jgi:hypothetical protein
MGHFMAYHWQSAVAAGLLAHYFFTLALWHSGGRPRVVSGAADAAHLGLGLGGLVLFGPFGQALARMLFVKQGVLGSLTLASGLALAALLLSHSAWRRVVIYNVDRESLAKALRDVLETSSGRYVPTLRGLEDPKDQRGVTIEMPGWSQTATIEAYGRDPETLARELGEGLRKSLAVVASPGSGNAWRFLGAAALVLIVPAAGWILQEPVARSALRAVFERLSGPPVR